MSNVTATVKALDGWEFDDPPTVESFEFERIDIVYWSEFVKINWHWSLYIAALYILVIFNLQRFMKNREPFDLKYVLFFWNASLGVFSIVGFIRATPPVFYLLSQENGFYNSICVKKGTNLPNVLWGILFIWSKVWELGDTIFIILRKRPIIFLHWYHHWTTLIVTWAVAPFTEPITRIYAGLNFFVHSFMYPYFALRSIGVRIPRYISRSITSLQFTKMILGLAVNLASLYLKKIGYPCVRHETSILAFGMLYGSFAILFGKLLYDSFMQNFRKDKFHKRD